MICSRKHQWRFSRQTHNSKKFVPRLHCKPQRPPYGFLQNANFAKSLGNTPGAASSCGQEYEIARAKPALFTFLIGHKSFARNNYNSLVHPVIPSEAARRAVPDHTMRGSVRTSDQFLAACYRRTAHNPFRGNWFRLKVDGSWNRRHNRFRQAIH